MTTDPVITAKNIAVPAPAPSVAGNVLTADTDGNVAWTASSSGYSPDNTSINLNGSSKLQLNLTHVNSWTAKQAIVPSTPGAALAVGTAGTNFLVDTSAGSVTTTQNTLDDGGGNLGTAGRIISQSSVGALGTTPTGANFYGFRSDSAGGGTAYVGNDTSVGVVGDSVFMYANNAVDVVGVTATYGAGAADTVYLSTNSVASLQVGDGISSPAKVSTLNTTLDDGSGNMILGAVAQGNISGVDTITTGNANIQNNPLGLNGSGLNMSYGDPSTNLAGSMGDYCFRTDTPGTPLQRIYVCTVAGSSASATWVGIA